MHAAYVVFSTALVMHNDVRSLGAPSALLRMTLLFGHTVPVAVGKDSGTALVLPANALTRKPLSS
jgi:hypothetical protein